MEAEFKPEQSSEPTRWTPEECLKIKTIASVRVSPDGMRVAYTVTNNLMTEENSEYLAQIWLANTDGIGAYQATFGEKSAENPRWSPNGKMLAFTSKRGEKKSLYLLRLEGGEAEQLTDAKDDVADFQWSPDGNTIALLKTDPPTEEEEKRKKAKDDWNWNQEDTKFNRLYLLPLEKDASGKRESRLLTKNDFQVESFDWSPDGKNIAFDHTLSPIEDYWPSSSISIVDVLTGEAAMLIDGPEAASRPLYSPDGRSVAFALSDDPPRWYFQNTIHTVPVSGGDPRALTASFDQNVSLIGWSHDSSHLYFQEPYRTKARLYSMHIETGEIKSLFDGAGNVDFSLNPSRTHIGFAYQNLDTPVEAFVANLSAFIPKQVSSANAERPQHALGKTEKLSWKSADGMEIEGLLTLPVGYEDGKRVPLLLIIHGGPAGVFQETFLGAPHIYPYAAFAAKGYATLRCNPRGSSGYGRDFRAANEKDWGGGDYQDLMRGVDTVIERGIADPERLGVMGWSYGGFMTSWIITQTTRFKAASIGAAVTNLMSFNGTADIPGFVPDYFGAESWENLEIYRDHCAMFQIGGVTTPSLIQHGESDIRVPISQGYEIYNALKRQGVETRMLILPRQPHGPNEPRMLLKVMETNLEWFEKHIKV